MLKFLLLPLLASMSLGAAARTELLPVDQGANDASFAAFRTELTEIVLQKNLPELLARVANNIDFSFGDDAGKKNFIKAWDLTPEKSADSAIWGELEKVLGLGGTFTGLREFTAPYTFSNWPENKDAFEHVAVVVSGLRVRSAPDVNAPVIYRATYEVLQVLDNGAGDPQKWWKVLTPSGQEGYVWSKFVRSPIDYRAIFKKNRNGTWLMRVFIAGD